MARRGNPTNTDLKSDSLVKLPTNGTDPEYYVNSDIGKLEFLGAASTAVTDKGGNTVNVDEAIDDIIAKLEADKNSEVFVEVAEDGAAGKTVYRKSFISRIKKNAAVATIEDVASNSHTINEDHDDLAGKFNEAVRN